MQAECYQYAFGGYNTTVYVYVVMANVCMIYIMCANAVSAPFGFDPAARERVPHAEGPDIEQPSGREEAKVRRHLLFT